jgi:hypothetical protein
LADPVAECTHGLLDQRVRKTQLLQVSSDSNGTLAPRGAKPDEILDEAAIVDEAFRAQPLDEFADDSGVEASLQQSTAQIPGRVITAGQAVQRRRPCGARI